MGARESIPRRDDFLDGSGCAKCEPYRALRGYNIATPTAATDRQGSMQKRKQQKALPAGEEEACSKADNSISGSYSALQSKVAAGGADRSS